MTLHLFGVRHHGPGSSRALIDALEELRPDLILVEGPPEGEECLDLLDDPQMKPPVAMLVYPADEPKSAVFYPYAIFSPEWIALQYARKNSIPLRLIDLPWKNRFALDRKNREVLEDLLKKIRPSIDPDANSDNNVVDENDLSENGNASAEGAESAGGSGLTGESESAGESLEGSEAKPIKQEVKERDLSQLIREDPLAVLARTAGYEENESWWDHVIEQSNGGSEVFQGILEAMTELRAVVREEEIRTKEESLLETEAKDFDSTEQAIRSKLEQVGNYEDLREAGMRRGIRDALRKGHERIAVVCGAWHVPVLDLQTTDEKRKKLIPAKKEDDALLSGLSKIKTTVTWCPWTCSRLASRSGYGAGVESPGWYDLLWRYPKNPASRWITLAARLLRKKGIDVSAANVIEAVRLSEALSAMRNRTAPALNELNDAILSVLCQGSSRQWELFRNQLEVGSVIGSVPETTPSVPLQRDIEKEQKRLRLKVSEEISYLDLDLRKENDRAKSCLFHRLQLLGIPWGTLQNTDQKLVSSFHEFWEVKWQAEFVVRIIEASVWGSTLESACAGAIENLLSSITALAELTQLLERVIPAEVPSEALEKIFIRLQNDAAVSSDIGGLMTAIPPLVQIIRYGNVRQTNRARVEPVFYALFNRVLIGLVPSCGTLDHEAAEKRILEIDTLQTALMTLNRSEILSDWFDVLTALMNSESIHELLCGRCCRLVYEQGLLSPEDLFIRFRLYISPAMESGSVGEWLQGFLKGSGQTLLHLDALWSMLNEWLCSLNSEVFMEMLPILRRSFSEFTRPELRQMGEKIKKLSVVGEQIGSGETKEKAPELDEKRISKLLPLFQKILGAN